MSVGTFCLFVCPLKPLLAGCPGAPPRKLDHKVQIVLPTFGKKPLFISFKTLCFPRPKKDFPINIYFSQLVNCGQSFSQTITSCRFLAVQLTTVFLNTSTAQYILSLIIQNTASHEIWKLSINKVGTAHTYVWFGQRENILMLLSLIQREDSLHQQINTRINGRKLSPPL